MASLRIVCISDTHGQHAKLHLPEGDILVHAGDFMAFGDKPREVTDFNQWLGKQTHRHKVVIAGNHDWMFERHPGAAQALLTNAIYLENSGTEIEGLKFWGSPVQPAFNNWAFNVSRGAAIRRYWERIAEDTDVLVTHGPPFGTLDQSHSIAPHLGCEELAERVAKLKPRWHIFGHIHGGHGQVNSNRTQSVNAAVLNEACELIHEAQIIEIEIEQSA
jgi:Icc-related predicted phosphoesterase